MNWIVYADGSVLARSGIADPTFMIASPEVKTELNKAGSFQFTIFPMHPYYDQLIKMKTKIDVVLNGENIFTGRVLYTQTDLYRQRKVYCEGCLAYLLDTVQESYEFNSKVTQFYDMTVYEFLDRLLVRHNKMFITDRMGVLDNFQNSLTDIGIPEGNTDTTERLYKALKVYNNTRTTNADVYHIDDSTKLFKLGTVNAEGTSDKFKFEIKGHKKTLDMILETLVDTIGGFIRAYRDPEDGWYVLEWRDKFGNENMQPIEFGSNLIELQQDESGVETFTRLYPSGKPSSGSGTSDNDTICLRETQIYFPVPWTYIVCDAPFDQHEPGTEITNPKASNFCEYDGTKYVVTNDTEPDWENEKQYYMPIYGDPLTLKVDDILNYAQVYMGEFNAIGVRIDALALNGNVDITMYPEFVVSNLKIYNYADGTALVTLIDQNGTAYEDSDTYMADVRSEAGAIGKLKAKDTEHRIIHVITGNAQAYHNKVVDIPSIANPHALGYYEYSNGSFVVTSDTSPVANKTYYVHSMAKFIEKIVEYSGEWYDAVDEYFPNGATPTSLGYYEVQQYGYVVTSDTRVVRDKNYYYLRDTPVHTEEKYGVIVRAVEFSDVNGANDEAKQHELYRRAVDYIQKNCTDLPEQITLTAIDLKNLDTTAEQMSIGRDIHVKSKPHDIDRHMKCISIDYYLDAPEKNVYVISSKPTGSDAIPKFTEQAETKKKSGSDGSTESGGGVGGFGNGGNTIEQTEEEIAVLKNHVYYTYGAEGEETETGSYYQLFAKALGMRLDENGKPIVDIEGNWAWDEVSDASTHRNSIITKLDLRPSSGALISEINASFLQVTDIPSGTNPKALGWYELATNVDWYVTGDDKVYSGKTYYDKNHREISDPENATYVVVTNTDGKHPNTEGWYILSDGNYVAAQDTEPVSGTTYYAKKSPKDLGWFYQKSEGNYKLTQDTFAHHGKTYYTKVDSGSTTIEYSKVEVQPGSVLIESVSGAYYDRIENPSGNPKAQGWYEKVDGNYRKTNDTSVQADPPKNYYSRKTDAEGSIEVTPGDVLIQAINQNGGSTAKIKADKITLQGDTTVDGILKVQDNALIVSGGNINVTRTGSPAAGGQISAYSLETNAGGHVTIGAPSGGSYGYLRFVGASSSQGATTYDFNATNVDDIIMGIRVVSAGTNQYKLQRQNVNSLGTETWEDIPNTTFNRAVTPVLNGGWSNGTYTVTSNPAAAENESTSIDLASNGSPTAGSNGYISMPMKVVHDGNSSADPPILPQDTGLARSFSIDCSSLLEEKTFTANKTDSWYTPSSGKIGFSKVKVNVPTGGSPSISLSNASKVSSAHTGATYCFSSVSELHSGTKGTYEFKITAGNSEKWYYFVITS